MRRKGADTRVRGIARRIVAAVDSEGLLHDAGPGLEGLLRKVQSEAISLSVSTSELIGLMKRQDPEYAAAVDAMENPQDEEPDAEPSDDAEAESDAESESDAEGEPEGKDEKE